MAFGLTCKALYALTVKKQRQSLEVYFDGLHTACASIGAPKLRLLNQQAAMLTIVSTRDASDHFQDGLESWHLQDWNCRCRVFAKKTVAVDQLFHRNEYRLAKSVKELTLSGGFSFQADGGYSWTSHPFMRSSGFKALRPETLRVNLSWNDWDFDILHGMSTTNLRVLKLPIRLPSDCLRLRQALATMPSLGSLAITDIPDREEFLIGLEQIGKGILSCAATLRELDIEMTNFNRPVSWDGDERFIQPKDVGFFFRKIFSCPPEQELLGLFELHARQGKTPMMGAPLSLTKLRLKHVNLPWYSFGTIFNATTIKHLHLPFSVVDCEEVWGLLETYAHLDTLTDISHDMLSPRFLAFLKEQSSLKELTFARPQEQYDVGDVVLYGASAYMTILVSDEAPRVGPNAVAKYPSFEKFLSSLENKAMLKHLALPPDMYRMTRDCLLFIAQSLTGLEHLELGFDYKDPVSHSVYMEPLKLTFVLAADASTNVYIPFPTHQPKAEEDHVLVTKATPTTARLRRRALSGFCRVFGHRFSGPQARPLHASDSGTRTFTGRHRSLLSPRNAC